MTVIYIILYELYFEEAEGNKVYFYHYAMNIGINLIKQFFPILICADIFNLCQ